MNDVKLWSCTLIEGICRLLWSSYGIRLFLVFPDILREFNPSLRGFSVGKGKENSPGAFFNQAVAGDHAE